MLAIKEEMSRQSLHFSSVLHCKSGKQGSKDPSADDEIKPENGYVSVAFMGTDFKICDHASCVLLYMKVTSSSSHS